MAYVKVHSKILDSSVWVGSPSHVKVLWVTLLALANQHGEVRGLSLPGLAKRAELTIPEVEDALRVFLAPDPMSSTPDYEGRRLIPLEDGKGWWLVTYVKHRAEGAPEERLRRNRERQRRYRARQQAGRVLTPEHADPDPFNGEGDPEDPWGGP